MGIYFILFFFALGFNCLYSHSVWLQLLLWSCHLLECTQVLNQLFLPRKFLGPLLPKFHLEQEHFKSHCVANKSDVIFTLISCLVQQTGIVLCGCPYKRVAQLPRRSAPCQKDIALNYNAPLCSWPVCTSTGPVELMADQAGIDSLPPPRFGTLVFCLCCLLSSLVVWCWSQALKLWSAIHRAVRVWLLGSESLPAPNFHPVSSSSDFVGSKSALQDLALGRTNPSCPWHMQSLVHKYS